MKSYGDVKFQTASAPVLNMEGTFPSVPTVGRVVFVNKRVWICAEIVSGQPVWVPLTNTIDTYVHTQSSTSTSWTVIHNLNTITPLVQIYDTTHSMVLPDLVTIVDNNTVTVSFGGALAGKAVVMYGDISGAAKGTFAYEHTQTSLASTWVVTHDLGYYPVVRVFVGTSEIQPVSIVHNSIYQTTLTFSQGYVGVARFA